MVYFLLFFAELFILFSLSKKLTNLLFSWFHKITRSTKVSIYLMSILFLPGTLLHELSHALMALLLMVRVGKMELFPKLHGQNLKLGSVEVEKSDPLRKLLIGMGPFLFGTILLLGIFFYGARAELFTNYIFVFTALYGVFEIGNTMFSSKKDMEGALEVIVALFAIAGILYIIGLRFPNNYPLLFLTNPVVQKTFQQACLYLLVPIVLDMVLIVMLRPFKI
jgi:hypothetical protein